MPHQPLEVLRMEVRLGSAKAIRQSLRNARLPTDDITFCRLYSQDYSQMVLEWQLKDMYAHYPKITEATADDPLALFGDLYIQNPNRNLSTILQAVGLHALSQYSGTRTIKDVAGARGSAALLRTAKRVNSELHYNSEKVEVFEQLASQLDRFEPVYLSNYFESN
jgi:hypothetical protein